MDENEQFIRIYDDYFQKIYRFIFYKTCHRETAEDICSLTFTRALEKWHSFDSRRGSISAWLYGIARNSIIDFYRKQQKQGFSLSINDIWDFPSSEDILKELLKREQNVKLHRILNKLPSKQREIIMFRLWEDLPYKEISKIMNRSEAGCKMLFSRTLKKLKNTLETTALLQIIYGGFSFTGGKNEQ